MARYFFHTFGERTYVDMIGTEIVDDRSVRPMALKAAAEVLADEAYDLAGSQWSMQVSDQKGNVVLGLEVAIFDHGFHFGVRQA